MTVAAIDWVGVWIWAGIFAVAFGFMGYWWWDARRMERRYDHEHLLPGRIAALEDEVLGDDS